MLPTLQTGATRITVYIDLGLVSQLGRNMYGDQGIYRLIYSEILVPTILWCCIGTKFNISHVCQMRFLECIRDYYLLILQFSIAENVQIRGCTSLPFYTLPSTIKSATRCHATARSVPSTST